ncbi:hypothetical protein HN643_03365 [Candidatus Falkowbacteria bacterium]|jgi:4-amino-4-deoxy-L-arabinose transferase-like glycosyltransferase|nr:hypothetical protein [Candidatus Falkowbacteria bacterium]MBT5503648.1 hypothetical protein [Candidatus Falkowbacteria bacterium]MBT6574112.1 hypothetical protein [Candidatus Falkowbacteria bacterium]MBT7500682.1 hypothetical protein [Candidatus Falkowbacteria bacterium]
MCKSITKNWRYIAILVVIVLIGLLVRLPEFRTVIPGQIDSSKVIWFDEALSIHYASLDFESLFNILKFDSSPPLFYLLLWLWQNIFGSSLTTLVLLPFIFSLASIVSVFYLAKEIFNKKIGLLASLFFSLSALNISYATELRTYSLLVFLVSLSMLFGWKGWQHNRNRDWILYIVFTLLSLYSHYTAIVYLAIWFVLLLFFNHHKWQKILSVHSPIFLLYVPQFLYFSRWQDLWAGDSRLTPFFQRTFSHGGYQEFLLYLKSLVFGKIYLADYSLLLGGFVFLLLVSITAYFWSERKMRFLFFLILGGYVGLAILKWVYVPKYFIIFTIPVVIFIASALFQIKNLLLKIGAFILIMILFSITVNANRATSIQDQFLFYAPSAYEFIEQNEQPGDLILTDHFNDLSLPHYYHGDSEVELFMPYENNLATADQRWRYWDYNVMTEENVGLVQGLIENNQRVWFFNYLPQSSGVQDPSGYLVNYLKENLNPVKYYYFPDNSEAVQKVELILFEKNVID